MSDIRPYCPYNFMIPKLNQKRLTYLSRYGMNKLKNQFFRCSDLSQIELEKLLIISSHSIIICDSNLDLIGFLIAKKEQNGTFIVKYLCGDINFTEQFVDFIKTICGYNHGCYDGYIKIFYSDKERNSIFKNLNFMMDDTFISDEYRNTMNVIFKYKGKYTYRKMLKSSLDIIKNNYIDI
jgi:hypothetical protein